MRIRWAGRRPRLWGSVIRELEEAEEYTRGNSTCTLTMRVNYGGRAEIADAVSAIAEDVAAGRLKPGAITERTIQKYLDEPDLPDVDLFLRSSGEQRLSNFMLWQSAYAEFVFMDTLWQTSTAGPCGTPSRSMPGVTAATAVQWMPPPRQAVSPDRNAARPPCPPGPPPRTSRRRGRRHGWPPGSGTQLCACEAQGAAGGLFDVNDGIHPHQFLGPLGLDRGAVREHHQDRRADIQPPFDGRVPGQDCRVAAADGERRRRAPLRIKDPFAVGLVADALPVARHFRESGRAAWVPCARTAPPGAWQCSGSGRRLGAPARERSG